jgi:cyanuric acid amidohydrolase
MQESEVHCVTMAAPNDVSGVAALLDEGRVEAEDIVAVIAQTEGDPYNRGYATLALQVLLGERLSCSHAEVFDRIPMMMIGGVAGIMCPHINLFVRKAPVGAASGGKRGGAAPGGKRMVLGTADSRVLVPEEYGTLVQVDLAAGAVKEAIADAGITDIADIECIEIKCPAMTPARVAEAEGRGKAVVNTNPVAASSMAKGAAALGIGVATGEIARQDITEGAINADKSLFTTLGSVSAGGEQVATRVLVIGNAEGAPGRFVAAHGVMEDQLDVAGARRAFVVAGLGLEDGVVAEAERRRMAAVFVNAGADAVPSVRGRRHPLHSDFLAPYAGYQAKAVCHAVVSSITGDTLLLASAGSEHQGRPGANLVCVIAEAE